jgi:hypothetical protein
MKYILSVIMAGLLFTACRNNTNPSTAASPAKDSIPQEDFFPVAEYIGGQLTLILDTFRFPLTKTITINGKSNLSSATDQEPRLWAEGFRKPDINDSSLRSFYKETSIADQSNGSVTLDYATANSRLPVQKIDVYIQADPVQNDKVTGIYIEKAFSLGDTSCSQKLYWKTGKNMQVFTEKKIKDKLLPVEQVKIAWDGSE